MIQRRNTYADRHALIRSIPRVRDLPSRIPEHRTHASAVLAFPGHCEYACAIEVHHARPRIGRVLIYAAGFFALATAVASAWF